MANNVTENSGPALPDHLGSPGLVLKDEPRVVDLAPATCRGFFVGSFTAVLIAHLVRSQSPNPTHYFQKTRTRWYSYQKEITRTV